MLEQLLIAGGGIAGLAAALAVSHTACGWEVRVFERAPVFSEFGAGVQLSPNVVRCLQDWGVQPALRAVAVQPAYLQAYSAQSGQLLAGMPLGEAMVQRYGAPYLTVHRADLHRVLLDAVRQRAGVYVKTNQAVLQVLDAPAASPVVSVRTSGYPCVEGDALLLADGVWGQLRSAVLSHSQPPQPTGHLAYRALIPMQAVPARWRTPNVRVWLGPRCHAVHYPVSAGEFLNLVVIVQGPAPADMASWDHAANAQDVAAALAGCCRALHEVVDSVAAHGGQWRLWPLSARPALSGPQEMARGLIALAGDAAHPMLPYLAQGAGMAIEDAAALRQALTMQEADVATRLQRYAWMRWQRNARVQQRAWRNGQIFHATGLMRWGRDLSMRLLGSQLMDMPWLYRGA